MTPQQPQSSTDCPFCGHERKLTITGCVVCAYHTLTVASKDDLSALLIDDLAALAKQTRHPRQRSRNKKTA